MITYLIRRFDEWWLSQIDIGRLDDGENWWKQGNHWMKFDNEGFYITITITA